MTETLNPDRISENPWSTWPVKSETLLTRSKIFHPLGQLDRLWKISLTVSGFLKDEFSAVGFRYFEDNMKLGVEFLVFPFVLLHYSRVWAYILD